MADENIVLLKDHRTTRVAMLTMPQLDPLPEGPFTVCISDKNGILFSAEFPDGSGVLPEEAMVHGVVGQGFDRVLANILAGCLKILFGQP